MIMTELRQVAHTDLSPSEGAVKLVITIRSGRPGGCSSLRG
ncbi:hypothetical protein ES708_30998 [subsurface metagenome]